MILSIGNYSLYYLTVIYCTKSKSIFKEFFLPKIYLIVCALCTQQARGICRGDMGGRHAFLILLESLSFADPASCKGDAFSSGIDALHRDFDHVSDRQLLRGMTDESVRDLGDVEKTVLVYTDIDKRAEIGDVSDSPRQNHALREILEREHLILERRRRE